MHAPDHTRQNLALSARRLAGGLRCLVSGAALLALLPHTALGMSLSEALVLTNQNDPVLLAARRGVKASNENIRQALAAAMPSVNGSASSSLSYSESLNSNDSFHTRNTLGLNFSQTLFAGGAVRGGIGLADASVRAAWAQLASIEQQRLAQAASTYMDIVRAQTLIALNGSTIRLRQEQLRAAQARLDAGVATITDVAVAQAALARGHAELTSAAQNAEVAKAALYEMTGRLPSTVHNPGLPAGMPGSQEQAVQQALANAPSIALSRAQLEQAEKNISVQKAAMLPQVRATGGATRSWDLPENSDWQSANSYNVGVSATIPLYAGGGTVSKIRQAKIEHSQALANLQAAQRAVRSSVMQAWNRYAGQQGVIGASQAQVQAAKASYDAVSEQARQGQASSFDVTQAEQELTQASISLATAQTDRIKAAYAVMAAMGALTPESVGGGQVFAPQQDYDQRRQQQFPEINRQSVQNWQAIQGEVVDFMNF